MKTLLSISILAGLALATACAGGAAVSTAEPPIDFPDSFEDLRYESPIEAFLGFDGGSAAAEAVRVEQEREVGRLASACMREAGFEYEPPAIGVPQPSRSSPDQPPYYSQEWIDVYGFGISTQRFRQSTVGPNLVGYADDALDDTAGPLDPNQDYVAGLSPTTQDAYLVALYGQTNDVEAGPDGGQPGCLNLAFDAVFDLETQTRFHETFGDELTDLRHRAEADPRYVVHRNEVSACAARHGIDWSPDEDPYLRFGAMLAEIEPSPLEDPFGDAGLDPNDMTRDEIDEFLASLEALDKRELAILAEIQAVEIATAKIVVTCGGGQLNEQYLLGLIQADYERAFLEANAARLSVFRHG